MSLKGCPKAEAEADAEADAEGDAACSFCTTFSGTAITCQNRTSSVDR